MMAYKLQLSQFAISNAAIFSRHESLTQTLFFREFEQRVFHEFDGRRFSVETSAPFVVSLFDELFDVRSQSFVHFAPVSRQREFMQKRSLEQHFPRTLDSEN